MKSRSKHYSLRKVLFAQTCAIFLLGLCVRLIYFYVNGASGGYDTLDYLKLADNLYNFGAYSLTDFPDLIPSLRRAPVYPYFLAFFQWIGGGTVSLESVAVVQCVLDALTAVAVFLLARKVVSKPLAFGAALFYIIHPGAIARTNLVLTETLFTFLLVTGVLVLITAFEKERTWLLILAGFILGLVVLTRPLAGIFPVLFTIIICLKFKSKKKYASMAIVGVVFLLTLAPWFFRCYAVAGQFVFVQGVSVFQFYAPTRIDLDQSDEKRLWKEFFDPQTDDEYFKKLAWAQTPADFIEAEKIGRQKAIENIKSHPKEYLISRIKAYPYFFLTGFDNFTGFNKSFRTLFSEGKIGILSIKIFLLIFFSLLPFVLSLVGLLRNSQNLTTLFCALVWFSTLLIHLPMWIEYRFWIPLVPFQIVSAAAGLAILRERFLPQKSPES